MDGKTALGASSPAKPALHIPDPLSTTRAATSSSHMMITLKNKNILNSKNEILIFFIFMNILKFLACYFFLSF
jgi:hypothetical protein